VKYLILLLFPFWAFAQPNCNYFLYQGDTLQYKACKLVENIDNQYYQFSREFQQRYDSALQICPHFAYGYREKSVAYLKSGDFLAWKSLIDKAVEYDALGNLGYRGWCRYQFFRDYVGAIADIERLDSLADYSIGFGANGDYHLNIAKALCYSALGQKQKAIDIINQELNNEKYEARLYDYYQLGVIYFEVEDWKNAQFCFEKQNQINQLAENVYYQAKIQKQLKNESEYKRLKIKALELYQSGKILFNPYTHHFNKVYLIDIEIL
jgi:tetratricopeptide (TPR) repeat protein